MAPGAIDFAPYNKRTFREGDARDLELLENLRATGRILNRRRKLLAIQAIAAAVAESVQIPPLSTILALGFVFGTEQTLNFGNLTWDLALDHLGRPMTPLPLWSLAETLAETPLDDLGRHLWDRVHPVLLKRLTILGTPSPEDVARA
ncbi:MAG TPA: hypothetical protein VGR07_05415 [Thermoanaerobaculia bacterium]|nr:hypothetical protein [Thermoanaerobaculia bacterium]